MRAIFLFILLSVFMISCDKSEVTGDVNPGSSTAGSTASMIIYHDFMYVLDNNKLKTLSLSDAKNPTLVNTLDIGAGNETIYAYKSNLFIGNTNGMKVLDISNPSNPVLISDIPQFTSRDPIVVKNDTAFQTRRFGSENGGHSGVLLINVVSNPSLPFTINQLELEFPMGLDYSGNYLYVGNGIFGMDVIDISDAGKTKIIRHFNEFKVRDIIATGDLLVCQSETGMLILSIADPAHPKLIKEIK